MALLIDRGETQAHISMEDGLKAMEDAFRELGEDPTINHPRRRLHVYDEVAMSNRRFNVFVGALPRRGYMGAERQT